MISVNQLLKQFLTFAQDTYYIRFTAEHVFYWEKLRLFNTEWRECYYGWVLPRTMDQTRIIIVSLCSYSLSLMQDIQKTVNTFHPLNSQDTFIYLNSSSLLSTFTLYFPHWCSGINCPFFSLTFFRSVCLIVCQVEHEKRQRTAASICNFPLLAWLLFNLVSL